MFREWYFQNSPPKQNGGDKTHHLWAVGGFRIWIFCQRVIVISSSALKTLQHAIIFTTEKNQKSTFPSTHSNLEPLPLPKNGGLIMAIFYWGGTVFDICTIKNICILGCFEGLTAYHDSPLSPLTTSRCKQVCTAKLLGFVGNSGSGKGKGSKHKHMAMFSRPQTICAIPEPPHWPNQEPSHWPKMVASSSPKPSHWKYHYQNIGIWGCFEGWIAYNDSPWHPLDDGGGAGVILEQNC